MSEPPVLVCPQCGAPRVADGTPSCSCAHRASEAHLESRTAEAAAAEDFDPVRIRPFVEVGEDPAESTEEPQRPVAEGELTATSLLSADVVPTGVLSPDGPPVDLPSSDGPGRQRRRTVLVAGAGAAVAVLVTGGFIGGLFSYDGPVRNGSVAGGVRAGAPEGQSTSGRPSAAASSPAATSTQSSAPPSPSPSAVTSAGATPTDTTTPVGTPSSAAATATAAPGPTESNGRPPVLRLGDQGAEVVELQLRLRQIGFYDGDADGDFDRDVQSAVRTYQVARLVLQDESGVYGAVTRTSLESETSQP